VVPEANADLGGSSPSPAGGGALEGQGGGLGPQEEKEGQGKHAGGEGQAGANVDPGAGQAGLSNPVLTHLSSAGGGALMNAMNMLRSAVGYGGSGGAGAEGGKTETLAEARPSSHPKSLGQFVAQRGVVPGKLRADTDMEKSPARTGGVPRDVFHSPRPVTPEPHMLLKISPAHALQQPEVHASESAGPASVDASSTSASSTAAVTAPRRLGDIPSNLTSTVTAAATVRSSLELWNDVMVFLPEILTPGSGPATPVLGPTAATAAVDPEAKHEGGDGRMEGTGNGKGDTNRQKVYDARVEEKRRSRRCQLWSKDEVHAFVCGGILCVCVAGGGGVGVEGAGCLCGCGFGSVYMYIHVLLCRLGRGG
jgi:hypothetical protein